MWQGERVRLVEVMARRLRLEIAELGGKGIRTPDFQLAKLALYQLSYAPGLECGM